MGAGGGPSTVLPSVQRDGPDALELVKSRWDNYRLPFFEGWLAFMASFAVFADLYILRSASEGWVPNPVVLSGVIAPPVTAVAAGVFALWFDRRRVSAIRLDATGLSIDTRAAGRFFLRWEDPKLSLMLMERGRRTQQRTRVVVWRRPFVFPGTAITASAAAALVSAAKQHGLRLAEIEVGVGPIRNRVTRIGG